MKSLISNTITRYILFNLCMLLGTISCGRQSTSEDAAKIAMAMMLDDADTPQNALVWMRSKSGEYSTHLLNGNKNHTVLVTSVPRLLLTTPKNVFEILQSEESIFLCDCAKWAQGNFEGDCPASLSNVKIQGLHLTTLSKTTDANIAETAGTADIDLLQIPIEEDHLGTFTEFHQKGEITGSIGPYVFISYERRFSVCNSEEAFFDQGFQIFNIETLAFESVLSETEKDAIDKAEKEDALVHISESDGFSHVSINDITLSQIKPLFFYGLGFSLGYEFEAESKMDNAENNWRSYGKAVTIQARQIPAQLRPFVIAPSVVRNLTHNENAALGGWSYTGGEESMVSKLLEELFNTRIIESQAPASDLPE